ncbi:MAG: hypothetical protein ACKVWR_21315, partial [Acidimicrobiales bacterium]
MLPHSRRERGADGRPALRIGPRKGLPGGRAALGGLLVAVAAVGAFVAASPPEGDRGEPYLAVAVPVAAGSPVPAEALITVRAQLAPEQAAQLIPAAAAAELTGALALAPLAPGDLVQRSAVRVAAEGGSEPALRSLSLSLPPTRADGGALKPGDRVDVLVTVGAGGDARTQVVADAVVG